MLNDNACPPAGASKLQIGQTRVACLPDVFRPIREGKIDQRWLTPIVVVTK